MADLATGDLAPDFSLPGNRGTVRLSEALTDGPVVVTFYQEDDTPTCRAQLAALRDDAEVLTELGARVLAISTDPLDTHEAFALTLGASFPLLSDADGAVARAYGVYDESSRRARRAVFVVGADRRLLLALPWYNPANAGQYEQIFHALGLDA